MRMLLSSRAWSKYLREVAEKREPGTCKKIDEGFSSIPQGLREGPWATLPTLFLLSVLLGVVLLTPWAVADFSPFPEAEGVFIWRCLGFSVGALVLGFMFASEWGAWPLLSWTMLGWLCFTLRFLSGVLGFRSVQRILTFPALLSNTVTVLVWYTAILPGIVVMTDKKDRYQVAKDWIFGPFLLTVHGLNEVFAVADWYLQPIQLELFDLWMGGVYSLCYLALYLGFLDPLGLHFYFILSPRKWWGALVYAGILWLMYSIWSGFNFWEAQMRLGDGSSSSSIGAAGAI